MSIKDAAVYLGVGYHQMRTAVKLRHVASEWIGGRKMVLRQSVMELSTPNQSQHAKPHNSEKTT